MSKASDVAKGANPKHRRVFGWIAAVLLYAVVNGCDRVEPDLLIANAYLREPAEGRTVASGYFEIDNRTPTAYTLLGARSELADRIEMHTHVRDGDMLRMREVDTVDIPPDSKVAFAPGGLHLMLFGVGAMTTDEVDVVLVFDAGREERVRFAVRRTNGGSP